LIRKHRDFGGYSLAQKKKKAFLLRSTRFFLTFVEKFNKKVQA